MVVYGICTYICNNSKYMYIHSIYKGIYAGTYIIQYNIIYIVVVYCHILGDVSPYSIVLYIILNILLYTA